MQGLHKEGECQQLDISKWAEILQRIILEYVINIGENNYRRGHSGAPKAPGRATWYIHFASCFYINIYCIMGCYYTLCHNTYGYSLLFYKVYIKRENAGSWDSGLEKEQIGGRIVFFAQTHFLACEGVAGGSQQSGGKHFFSRNTVARPVGPCCQVEE